MGSDNATEPYRDLHEGALWQLDHLPPGALDLVVVRELPEGAVRDHGPEPQRLGDAPSATAR